MVNRAYSPFGEMLTLRDAMNQLFEESLVRPGALLARASATTFPINAYIEGDTLTVEALLPGVSPEDVQVTLDQGVLTLQATRQGVTPTAEGQSRTWYLHEFSPGQFTRAISLPFPAEMEQVSASFSNGLLTVRVPKAEAAKPKQITIGSGQQQQISAQAQEH